MPFDNKLSKFEIYAKKIVIHFYVADLMLTRYPKCWLPV